MDTRAFKDLYRKVWNTRVKDFPVSSLSCLLHGFLAAYSMVRVFPWLEDSYVCGGFDGFLFDVFGYGYSK